MSFWSNYLENLMIVVVTWLCKAMGYPCFFKTLYIMINNIGILHETVDKKSKMQIQRWIFKFNN